MTTRNENSREVEQDSLLEKILQTVRSIDRNVEEIHDTLSEDYDAESYGDELNLDEYLNENGY
jgi:hypothetical protein